MKIPLLSCLLCSVFAIGTLPCFGVEIEDFYNPKLEPFYHGVASGDPLPDGVIIWTRVTPKNDKTEEIRVRWTVSTDKEMTAVVASGETLAKDNHDFTVKVDVRGLAPSQTYYYAFRAMGQDSPIGRTRTAPNGPVGELKFAVVSCANFEWGYFAGYRRISQRSDLDAVIHTGDYLYEYPDNDSYSDEEIRDERRLFPKSETVSLKDYRKRFATYRLDKNLQRAHRQHPFIVIWDDHEFANDAWEHGAGNHQKNTEGDWELRKERAKRAYFEWMPIRENGDKIYRTLQYGPLADLVMIDTRVEGRSKQIDDVTNPKLYDPDRTMLGNKQEQWLKEQLSGSDATWKLIVNQVVFSEFNIGFAADTSVTSRFLESQFLDIWDGYPKERRSLVKFMRNQPITNAVILTGDIHASFAFEVADPAFDNPDYNPDTGAGAVAVEFVTPSLTAANFDEEAGDFFTESIEDRINSPDEDTGENPNPHMKFADLDRHGYIVLTVQPEQVQADYYYLRNLRNPESKESWGTGLITAAGTNHLVEANAPASAAAALDSLLPDED